MGTLTLWIRGLFLPHASKHSAKYLGIFLEAATSFCMEGRNNSVEPWRDSRNSSSQVVAPLWSMSHSDVQSGARYRFHKRFGPEGESHP
jgi:hypothetical protein